MDAIKKLIDAYIYDLIQSTICCGDEKNGATDS